MTNRRLNWVMLLTCAGFSLACSGERSDSFEHDGSTRDAESDTSQDASQEEQDASSGGDDAGTVGCAPPTAGPTMHTGEITGTETWTAAGSPHVITYDVNVRDGAKLVIAPCAVVQFAEGTSLNVAYPLTPNTGELVAEGTAAQPIRFEPLDGASWDNILVHAPGIARLAHVTIVGGGGQNSSVGESLLAIGDGELPSDAVIALDHVTIDGAQGTGLKLSRDAKFVSGSRDLVVKNSGRAENPYPVELGELGIDSLPSGSYTGNEVDEIMISPQVVSGLGGLTESATMHDRGVPYHVGDTENIDHLRVGAPEGQPAVTLTIEPGVTVKFLPGTALTVEFATGEFAAGGILKAVGTAERPIVFTSASATPAPGAWRGLWYGGIASDQNQLEHVRIEYTGADCGCILVTCNSDVVEYEGAIIFTQPPPGVFMSNTVIAHGSSHGVVLGYDGPALDFRATNTFEDMAGCIQTLPRNADTSCPDPEPPCVR